MDLPIATSTLANPQTDRRPATLLTIPELPGRVEIRDADSPAVRITGAARCGPT
jgi:hypothetical protein